MAGVQWLPCFDKAIIISQSLENSWIHYPGRGKPPTVEVYVGRSTARNTSVDNLNYVFWNPRCAGVSALWYAYVPVGASPFEGKKNRNVNVISYREVADAEISQSGGMI